MKKRLLLAYLLVIIFGLAWVNSLGVALGSEFSVASDYERIYAFKVQYGYYQLNNKLYLSMPPSLYDYYRSKSHVVYSDKDYAKFVTPSVFKFVAESIRNVTRNLPNSDEQFANAVLTLVHQIAYVKSNVKYPVEAIMDNSGDCDVLSLLAASIMKAGGLDVVLLLYKDLSPSHMNVGVYLPHTPAYRTWWIASASYDYNNKTYWMAECTSQGEWKVGDRPGLLANAEPQVISLENCEKTSPAQISSSLKGPLIPLSVSITLFSENSSVGEKEGALTISGSISPACSGKSVVMYVNQAGTSYRIFRTVTDQFGNYSFKWNFTTTGTYYFRTSCSDFSDYAGSDSAKLTVFIGYYQPFVDEPTSYWDGFDHALSRLNAAMFGSQSGKEFLRSNVTGTGVLLSGEFIMLKNNQTTPAESKKTIIIPAGKYVIRLPRSREPLIILREEQTITMPSEQAANYQLGFMLRRSDGNNYNASIKLLDDNDLYQVTKQLGKNNTAFINATMSTRENTWYRVAARISESAVTTELYAENGTLLKNIAANNEAINISESGVLITYSRGTIIAFKNLKVETLDTPARSEDDEQLPVNAFELSTLHIVLAILLAAAIAGIVCVNERRRAAKK